MSATEGNSAGLWTVFDLNQGGPNHPPRYHNVHGQDWPLFRHQGCPMPPHIAAVFLRDPAFRVVDETGATRATLPVSERLQAGAKRMKLEPDETVAKFEELTTKALLTRAVIRPGGEGFNAKTARAALIEFLEAAPVTAELAEHEKPRGTGSVPENTPDDMDGADLDGVLGPKPADVTASLMGG